MHVLGFLLLAGLLLQGIPTRPDQTGVVTGTLRRSDGKPAAGIRVAARAAGDSPADAAVDGVLAGLADTDEMGHFRLEGVPRGRYTITAGRVDFPTYYPGTQDLARGRILTIEPGSVTTGIDFTLADSSYAAAGVAGLPAGVSITIDVKVEGGGKVPVFFNGNFVQVVLRPEDAKSPAVYTALTAPSVVLPFPTATTPFRATVENLPPGFALRSMTYGSTNLTTSALPLSPADLPPAQTRVSQLQALGLVPILSTGAVSSKTLSITLTGRLPVPSATGGVRVSGRVSGAGDRSVYVSEIPGIVYSDGTFDAFGVPPGKHLVVSNGASGRPSGTVLVVGDRDLDGVQLQPVVLLPIQSPEPSKDTRAPGTVVPLAGLRGRVVSDPTGQPVHGILNIVGDSLQAGYELGDDGTFRIPALLPGSYKLQVSIFDHYTLDQTVVVGEADRTVELRVKRAY